MSLLLLLRRWLAPAPAVPVPDRRYTTVLGARVYSAVAGERRYQALAAPRVYEATA